MRPPLFLVVGVLTLAGCGSVDQDRPLSEQTDDGDRADAVEMVVDDSGGVIVASEAECWVDAIIESGATPAELAAFGADPMSISSAEISDALVGCLDQSLDVSVPIEGDVREQLIAGFISGGLEREAAECTLDELTMSGVDARALTIAGWNDAASAEIERYVFEAIAACRLDLG